jgi:hypothetical protein
MPGVCFIRMRNDLLFTCQRAMPIIITRFGTAHLSGQSEREELEAKIGTTHIGRINSHV